MPAALLLHSIFSSWGGWAAGGRHTEEVRAGQRRRYITEHNQHQVNDVYKQPTAVMWKKKKKKKKCIVYVIALRLMIQLPRFSSLLQRWHATEVALWCHHHHQAWCNHGSLLQVFHSGSPEHLTVVVVWSLCSQIQSIVFNHDSENKRLV